MSDLLESAGAGTAAGGLMTWLISYIKNRDMKKEMDGKLNKESYEKDQASLHEKIALLTSQHVVVCNIRTEAIERRLDDLGTLQTKMDEKLDKLIERRSKDRE